MERVEKTSSVEWIMEKWLPTYELFVINEAFACSVFGVCSNGCFDDEFHEFLRNLFNIPELDAQSAPANIARNFQPQAKPKSI
jgi:hypothetical protein